MPDKPLPSAATLFKAPLPKAESLFRAPARAAAPAKPAPKPKQESGFSKGFGEFENTVGRAFQSAAGSAKANAGGLYDIVRHPIKSASSAASLAAGGLYNAGVPRPPSWMTADPGEYDRDRKHASGFAQGYKDRYGSGDRIKHTFETDPVGFLLDASVVAGGASGLVRGGARAAGRAAVGAEVGGVRGAARFALHPDPLTGKPEGWSQRGPAGVNVKRANAAGAKAAPLAAPRQQQEPGKLHNAKLELQKAVAPETINSTTRRVASLHRAAHGLARGDAAAAGYALARHSSVVLRASAEERKALAIHMDTGKGLASLPPRLQAAAHTMRNVYAKYRSRIENILGSGPDGPKFIEHYYARMWKESPQEVARKMAGWDDAPLGGTKGFGGRQGSGRNLRKRSIPTYAEGLARGLTPVFENPLDATHAYADNMAGFLATHDTLNGLRKEGIAKWVFEEKIPQGMRALEGIGTKRRAILEKGIPARVLAAPDDAALVYNRTTTTGMTSPIYKGLHSAANAVVKLKLGLSAFHATVMGEEGLVSAFAGGLDRSVRGLARGDLKQAGRGLKSMAASPLAPYRTAKAGAKLRKSILDPEAGLEPELAAMYKRAGGRVSMDRFYNAGASGNFWKSFKSGFIADGGPTSRLGKTAEGLKAVGGDLKESLGQIGDAPGRGTLKLFGKMMDTVAAPIFEDLVPNMKSGAWARRMSQWMEDNPEHTLAERDRFAEDLVQHMDNRFGELILDNQFWDKTAFQISQILMLSPSWNFGTVREIGGAVPKLPSSLRSAIAGEGLDEKVSYVASLAATYLIQNGILTYLHTRKMPEGMDWLAHPTGQTDEKGNPVRNVIPGYMKDVLSFIAGPSVLGELENKANPLLSLIYQLAGNKDHFDNDIRDKSTSGPAQVGQVAKYTAGQLEPISVSKTRRKGGDWLSTIEAAAGFNEAPAYLRDPNYQQEAEARSHTSYMRGQTYANRKAAAANTASTTSALPKAESLFTAPLPKAESLFKAPEGGGRMKPGAMMPGAAFRPEFKPVVALVGAVPGIRELTGGNDAYHKWGAHLDGRGADFNLEPGAQPAQVVARIRAKLKAAGYSNVRVLDEYSHPSRNATGGHIHVEYR